MVLYTDWFTLLYTFHIWIIGPCTPAVFSIWNFHEVRWIELTCKNAFELSHIIILKILLLVVQYGLGISPHVSPA